MGDKLPCGRWSTDVQRACRSAVQRVVVYYALLGIEVSSTNTGAYCRARGKVTEGVVRHLAEGVAERCEAAVPDEWRWKGFRATWSDDGIDILDALMTRRTVRGIPSSIASRGWGSQFCVPSR